MTRPGVRRQGTEQCYVEKPYVFNDSFVCVAGHRYWVNHELVFGLDTQSTPWQRPVDCKPDGTYRTIFGPSVPIDAVIYQNNDDNVSKGLRRLTACRIPPLPCWSFHGWEYHLRKNQVNFLRDNHDELVELAQSYAVHVGPFQGVFMEACRHYADPHPKQKLRVQAMSDMTNTGQLGARLWLKHVTYKMKKDEYAKPGKMARMIGDLKVPASLQGFRVTALLKEALGKQVNQFRGGAWRFCKSATADLLQEQFDLLITPPGIFYFAFFSDDSCLSVRGRDGVYRFNMDISSCDASHTDELFQLLSDLTPELRDEMVLLADQCRCDIRIYSVARNIGNKRFVQLRPKGARLYSGSTITTYINSVSQLVMMLAFSTLPFRDMGVAEAGVAIENACLQAGYVVTLEQCDLVEDIQFLKYSPAMDASGRYRPLLNLGTLLRTSGVCRGDLPGRGSVVERALRFQKALLTGMSPGTSHPLIDVMRRRCDHATLDAESVKKATELLYEKMAGVEATFDLISSTKRYRLTAGEAHEMVESMGVAGVGDVVYTDGIDKIMRKDYGYGLKLLH